MFPTRSSLVKEPGHSALPSRHFPQRRSGNLLPPVRLVNNFFFVPRNFFRSAIRFPFRRCRSGKLVRSAELVNSFFELPIFFQTRNHSLPFVFQLPGGFSDCPIRSILSTTCFSESKKRTASLPASLGGAFLQPELPFRSGEVALWPFHPLLSTLFPIFFQNLVSPFGHINFIHI